MSIRKSNGVGIQLTIMGSFVSAVLGVGLFNIAMLLGTNNELANAVDAGALNVAKCSQLINLKPGFDPDERQFASVTNDSGQIDIENVNRVWGMAMLINLNAAEMGDANGSGTHADQIFLAAQRISGRLASQLKNQKNLHPYFNQSAGANTVRMSGTEGKVQTKAGNDWQVSYVDAGQETNLIINKEQLPGKSDYQKLNVIENNGKSMVRGYKSIKVRGRDFVFVPMKEGGQPHRISSVTFNKAKSAPFAPTVLTGIVPNAFSASGAIVNSEKVKGLAAVSFAQANPAKAFKLAIPNGYIKIKLQKNKLKMRVNGFLEEKEYEFRPGQKFVSGSKFAGLGVIRGTAYVGNEYLIPTLEKVIYTFDEDDYVGMTKTLLQRVREINPEFSEKDLRSALKSCPVIPGVYDYVIYQSKSGKLKAGTLTEGQISNPIGMSFGQPEGFEKTIAHDEKYMYPNFGTVRLSGFGVYVYAPQFAIVSEEGDLNWKAGTGYNGCLGELSVKRTCTMLFNGAVVPPL